METIKTKHTPGPWKWENVSCNDGKDFQRLYGGDLRILTIRRSSTLRSANADLIAAAPELLKALKSSMNYTLSDGSLCCCPVGENEIVGRFPKAHTTDCETRRYAIRKAELGA